MRNGETGLRCRKMMKQRRLELAFQLWFTGIDDFQYPVSIRAGFETKITITLAVELRGRCINAKTSFASCSASITEN